MNKKREPPRLSAGINTKAIGSQRGKEKMNALLAREISVLFLTWRDQFVAVHD